MSSRIIKDAESAAPAPLTFRSVANSPPSAAARPGAPGGISEADAQAQAGQAYQRGRHEGEAAARGALQPVVERLAQAIDGLAGLRGRAHKEAETELLKLAVAIARRILHRELSVDPEAVSGIMKAALDRLRAQEIHRVRVHPDLEAAVRVALERFASSRSVQIVADRGRQPGDIVFETERGSLDASVETQLQEIGRGLADRLRGRW
jgi:flagellar assembly protein FliH